MFRISQTRRGLWAAAVPVALVAAVFGARAADDTGSPAATIATLQQGLVALARDKPRAAIEERYLALEPLIIATHHLPYIAEFALRRHWGSLNDSDRQKFVTAFQRLSVMTYAARFRNVAPGAFRAVTPAAAADDNGRVQVATAVARAGQPDVTLSYLLQQDGEGWRIINVVADGVSDLALKRAEYQRLYAAGSLAGLLAELESQTERLLGN